MKQAGLRDMTQGSVLSHMVAFAVPLLLGNFLQQFYNMVDSWVVGNFVGDTALTAVGAGSSIVYLFVSLFSGVGTGATVVVSQFFGARREDRVRAVVDTIYRTILLAAVPVTLVAFFSTDWLIAVMNVDSVAVPEARQYISILAVGLVSTIGYNINDGILRGLGNSRASLLFLSVSACVNILLDLLLVTVFSMGVAGAAIATVLAQTASWLAGIVYIGRTYPAFRIRLKGVRFEGTLLQSVLRIGLPAGLQMATISIGGMAVMAKVNTFGNSYSAGYTVGLKIDNLVFLPVQALSNAATALVGQNVGADREDRVRQAAKCVVTACLIWCAVGISLLWPIRRQLVSLFTSTPETVACGAQFVGWVMPAYCLLSIIFSLNSVMRGAGESLVPMLVAVIGQIFVRVPAVYLLAGWLGPDYMYGGFAVGWLVGAALAVSYFASGRWKRRWYASRDKNVCKTG